MVDVHNYGFNILTAKTVKPEESIINTYVNECFESEGEISATRRMRRILDARYKEVDLNNIMTEQCQNLNGEERDQRLILLRKYEDISNGTIGTCNTTPVYLELRDDENLV